MLFILLASLTAYLVTLCTTPLVIRLAKRFKLVDDPQQRPHPAHIQNRIVPRAGGAAIFLGIVVAIFFFVPLDKHIIGIVLSLIVLLTVGIIDDILTNFSPIRRLLLQILAAGIIVASGVGISFVTNPFGGILRLDTIVFPLEFFGRHNILLIADLFAFLWIVWMMNMINWSKGVDGQMPGIILVAGITIGIISYKLFIQGDPNQLSIAMLSFITAAAAAGFLFFNWHPAKIFPGFSGSTILGFMIAVLSILSGAKLATALLVLLIPSVDFLYTFFRRLVSGKSPFLGDQKHLHHLLLQNGWSHQKISLFYISTCAMLGIAAGNLSSQGKLFTVIGVGVIVLGLLVWLHLLAKNLEKDT